MVNTYTHRITKQINVSIANISELRASPFRGLRVANVQMYCANRLNRKEYLCFVHKWATTERGLGPLGPNPSEGVNLFAILIEWWTKRTSFLLYLENFTTSEARSKVFLSFASFLSLERKEVSEKLSELARKVFPFSFFASFFLFL